VVEKFTIKLALQLVSMSVM